MNVVVENALEPEEQVCWRTWCGTVERHSGLEAGRSYLTLFRQHKHYLQELKSSFK